MTANTIVRLEQEQIDRLVKELEASFNVWIGVQSVLDGDDDNHKGWLGGRRAEIKWRYWERFQRLLEEDQGWPRETVERLGEMTDAVLERLEDPLREGPWDRRGLVAGHVQSGKTANYTGLVCKAADAGYKLIIILAGIHSSLRSQTQLRLDEGFLGYDSRQGQGQGARTPVGVGRLDPNCPPVDSITNSLENGDFNRRVAEQFKINPGGNPLLFVIKKNASVLKNLLGWVKWAAPHRDDQGRPVVTNLPLLLVDDEADFASVDTKAIPLDENGNPDPDHDPTKINSLIRTLLHTFRQSVYVGYTATPFANIFIHEQAETKDEGPDLFPRSFIINLPAPSNYVGPVRVFGLDPDPDAGLEGLPGLPILRTEEVMRDYMTWMPDGHKKEHAPGPLPASLCEAIRAFVLVCAARLARGQSTVHNSMLVHVTRFTAVQEKVAALVRDEIKAIEQRLKRGDGKAPYKLADELRTLWERDFEPTTTVIAEAEAESRRRRSGRMRDFEPTTAIANSDLPIMGWEQIEQHLYPAAAKIRVRTVNGSAGDVLDYVDNRGDGLSVIAVGGDKLSRGLTLEGLSVSYYLRASRMYDTLMQMGRWFGYRPGYMDLCRLYTTNELIGWYRHITAASEELRQLFDHMKAIGSTPKDFGFRVKSHPDGLMVTASVKMRHSTELEFSYAGRISETVVFETGPAARRNYEAACHFIEVLGEPHHVVPNTRKLIWRDVPAMTILDVFLSGITTPSDEVIKVRPDLLSSYIKKLNALGELESWTVVLSGTADGTPHTLAGHEIGLVKRSPLDTQVKDHDATAVTTDEAAQPGRLYRIRRVVSPADERLDLTDAELARALSLTQAAWQPDPGRSQRQEPPTTPGPEEVRAVRSSKNGLLLLYPLDTATTKTPLPLIGFAFSFPDSTNAQKVTYRVDNRYWQQEFGG